MPLDRLIWGAETRTNQTYQNLNHAFLFFWNANFVWVRIYFCVVRASIKNRFISIEECNLRWWEVRKCEMCLSIRGRVTDPLRMCGQCAIWLSCFSHLGKLCLTGTGLISIYIIGASGVFCSRFSLATHSDVECHGNLNAENTCLKYSVQND